jgi:hypothetical protein
MSRHAIFFGAYFSKKYIMAPAVPFYILWPKTHTLQALFNGLGVFCAMPYFVV